MNIHQTVPRSDCTSFAKCGKHSLAYCRKYGVSECGLCEIVKRKPRNRVMVDGGRTQGVQPLQKTASTILLL